jgi:hypothetical protein
LFAADSIIADDDTLLLDELILLIDDTLELVMMVLLDVFNFLMIGLLFLEILR